MMKRVYLKQADRSMSMPGSGDAGHLQEVVPQSQHLIGG